MDALAAQEVVKFLQTYLDDPQRIGEGGQPRVAAVSCLDGRLNPFLRPFSFVIRTAGAIAEAVEGSVGLANETSGATLLASHGDCLAIQAAIEYLRASLAGGRREPGTVANMNRHDTRALLMYINSQWRLDALPAPDDQTALSALGITYAIQWTARASMGKPRVGLFIDLKSVLGTPSRVWVVSYDGFAGRELAGFLQAHGMKPDTLRDHVLTQAIKISSKAGALALHR